MSGNAAKSGIATGDTVVYTSSFFGDELWPSDDVNFTKSAINAAPSPVCLVYVSLPVAVQQLLALIGLQAELPIANTGFCLDEAFITCLHHAVLLCSATVVCLAAVCPKRKPLHSLMTHEDKAYEP